MYIASQNGDTDVVDLLVQAGAGADIHLATTEVNNAQHNKLSRCPCMLLGILVFFDSPDALFIELEE